MRRSIFSLLAGAALSNWVSLPAHAASFDTYAAALSSRRFLRAHTLPDWGSGNKQISLRQQNVHSATSSEAAPAWRPRPDQRSEKQQTL